MTAKAMQDALFRWCAERRHRIIVPNFYLFWECDILSITQARVAYEFEVKVTLKDFRADLKKQAKHGLLAELHAKTAPEKLKRRLPNCFYYAVPQAIAEKARAELPIYAGLLIFDATYEVAVKAPRLHDEQIDALMLMRIATSLMHHYWRQRTNGVDNEAKITDTPENPPTDL
jgi:hypothetical protein